MGQDIKCFLVDIAKEAGADADKFQHFKAETIVSDFGFKNVNLIYLGNFPLNNNLEKEAKGIIALLQNIPYGKIHKYYHTNE